MNYCDTLLKDCALLGDRRLAFELDTGRDITFGELRKRVEALAAHLARRSIGPGTSVAIHLYNSIDAIVMHMAVQYVGARSCFVDALVQPKSLFHYVNITSCQMLVTHCATELLEPRVLERTAILRADAICSIVEEGTVEQKPALYDWPPDEVSYVYFTSGTTSDPKGVMLTSSNHENFIRICDTYWQPVSEASKHICFVPFSHGFGTIFLVPLALRSRSELYILRAFHPLRVAEAIRKHRITHIYGVPSHFQQMLRLPDAQAILSQLKMAFCAAAKLEHESMVKWEQISGIILCEGYGLIETCCGVVWRVGVPSRGTGHMGPCPDASLAEIGIMDESDQLLPRGMPGQIVVRGPSVMRGYLANDPETARVKRGDWFLTGDEGYITVDGELFMTGRIKDIINVAGIKVSPFEVEAVLHKHPAVAESAVVSESDALYGEVVKAYVRIKGDTQVSERELIRFAAQHLINFQVPKRVEFVEAFPLNNMGKLDRKQLRARDQV